VVREDHHDVGPPFGIHSLASVELVAYGSVLLTGNTPCSM
jgi:hypothetical protein